MIKFIGSFFLIIPMPNLLLENISKDELKKYLKELYSYLKIKMDKIDRDPKVFFHEDENNADDILGKTGYYDPENEEIHLYVTNRHPKDILRSFAHEVVHHEQNCSGFTDTIDMSKTSELDYASKDPGLRKAEKDAFTRGNMFFRDWTDSLKVKKSKETSVMSENTKLDKSKSDLNKDGKLSGYEKKRGAAIAKAMSANGKKKKPKDEVEEAKMTAKKHAREQMKHQRGKDMEDLEEQEAKENLEETIFPYQSLLERKERIMKEQFNRREENIYNALLEKFGIK